MSITLNGKDLATALASVTSVVEARNTIPILSNIRLMTEGGALVITATDLDIEARAAVSCTGDLACTVPAKLFDHIVKKLPEGAEVSLALDADGKALIIKSGRSRMQLHVLPVQDFPDLSLGEMPEAFTLPASDLLRLIESTAFCISTEETRYYLNGIYLHIVNTDSGTMLRAVATDGHRLAKAEMTAPEACVDMPGVIVPRKTVETMAKDLAKLPAGADVSLAVSTQKLRYISPAVTLVSKLIDGTFPDYTRVIPVGNDKRFTMEREAMAAAVTRVSTISSERGRAVKCSFSEDAAARLSVTNPDAGIAEEEIEGQFEGGGLTIGFNAKYMESILDHISGETVTCMFADPASPSIWTGSTHGTLYVLMPMRV